MLRNIAEKIVKECLAISKGGDRYTDLSISKF